jgi:glucan-binding YG repeat protein
MLSVGSATLTAMADEGWAQSGSDWVYYDSSGNQVYNAWKKGADNQWRYLNGDGVMAVSTWVDSDYYVDSNGIMLTEKWLKMTSDDGEYEWYYFGSSGKKIDDTWKKIDDNWYHFDSDGRMELGWILDDMYYTGTDGVMRTGWQRLYPPDSYDEQKDKIVPSFDTEDEDDGKYWFYFNSSGKKSVPKENSSSDYGYRKIDGVYYCFDEDGALQTGWQKVGSGDSITDYMYFGSDGQAKIGWYSVEPPEDLNGYDGDVEWFYFNNSGKPRAASSDRLSVSDLVKLNGKTYLFNELGNPVYGLKKVYLGSGEDNWTAFYFGTKDKSCVQKGKMKVTEDDGNKSEFYFTDNGRGYTGVKDNYLYYKGKLQKATDGEKYVCYRVDKSNYVVNSSGKVMKGTTVKNGDGVKFTTSSNGTLSKADDDSDISSYITEPMEPMCSE